MKLKIVVIDLEIPPKVKKWGLRISIPLAVLLGGSAIAWAATLHTWNTGDTLQATDLNGNFAALQAEITALQKPASGFHAHLTKPLMVQSGATPTVVFDSVDFDLGSEYTVANGFFTVKQAGTYLLNCSLEYAAAGTVSGWSAILVKNASSEIDADDVQSTTYSDFNGGITARVTTIAQLAAGDFVTCEAAQGTSGLQGINEGASDRDEFSAARLY
jgi:hypothetical protein